MRETDCEIRVRDGFELEHSVKKDKAPSVLVICSPRQGLIRSSRSQLS